MATPGITASIPSHDVLYGTPHVLGKAFGTLLASDLELSFWGGVDQVTGEVVDRFHPLSNQLFKDKILAIPGGRGSCSGSATILEFILNGNGPRALIFERTNDILAVGVFVAEELFGKSIPMVTLSEQSFKNIIGWDGQTIYIQGHQISRFPLGSSIDESRFILDVNTSLREPKLSDSDLEMLQGKSKDGSSHSKAHALAMKIIIRTASIMDASSLMSISQAHVDGAHFGPASVLSGTKLRSLGGFFAVPTTINALTIDQQRWQDLGVDVTHGTESSELASAFVNMGAQMSFTCAPYQLPSVPTLGAQVAFGESNVVCYANSVLGARTAKYPNMLEALIALTGRAPRAGVHLTKNRAPRVCISAPSLHQNRSTALDDSFWPLLGYEIGFRTGSRIPIIIGLKNVEPKPSSDDLKAFSAAFATSAGAPMFHMVDVTPEAQHFEGLITTNPSLPGITISWADLLARWTEFNTPSTTREVDLISLGNPHFSIQELARLSRLVQNRTKDATTRIIVTTSRAQHSLATQAGYIAQLELFGVQVLTDTCWCFIRDPVIESSVKCIMTNSGKYTHYGPGLTGRAFRFGGLQDCVEAACTGIWSSAKPLWLQTGVERPH